MALTEYVIHACTSFCVFSGSAGPKASHHASHHRPRNPLTPLPPPCLRWFFSCFVFFLSLEQCAKDCTYTYDASLTKCNQQVSDQTKNTYGANLDACANIASGVMDDCMVSFCCCSCLSSYFFIYFFFPFLFLSSAPLVHILHYD